MGMMISRNRERARKRELEAVEAVKEPTRAELAEKAEAMGIKVPAKATKAEILKLIEEQ